MTETDTFKNGIGVLAASNGSIDNIRENSPIAINGVAIPENTVLKGGQEVEYFFTPQMAERAAEVLQRQIKDDKVHIVKNFHEIDGQASADDILGEVTTAGYSQGVGVVFEGEITDMDIAQKINNGYLDVSPSVARALGVFNETMQAREVDEVAGFRDIAVVGNGQPGATVEVGDNPAISTLSLDALSRAMDDVSTDTMQLTDEQQSLVESALDDFVSTQGNATLRDLQSWVYESEDLDSDTKVALEAAMDDVFESFDPDFSEFRIEMFREWLTQTDTLENIEMSLDEAKETIAEEYGIDTDTLDEKLSESEPDDVDENTVVLIEE